MSGVVDAHKWILEAIQQSENNADQYDAEGKAAVLGMVEEQRAHMLENYQNKCQELETKVRKVVLNMYSYVSNLPTNPVPPSKRPALAAILIDVVQEMDSIGITIQDGLLLALQRIAGQGPDIAMGGKK